MNFLRMAGLFLGFFVMVPAIADEIPASLLQLDLEKCSATCPTVNGEKVCKFLCKCTIDHFKKGLDYDKYVVLMAEMSRQKISQKNKLFLLDVGRSCEGQLDAKFPELKKEMLKPLKKSQAKTKN